METVKVPINGGAPPVGEAPKAGEEGKASAAEANVKAGETQESAPKEAAEAAPVSPSDLTKKEEPAKAEGEKTAEQLEVEKVTGLDLTPFANEFIEKGALSEESFKALEAKGISPETANTYIAGLQAQATAHQATLAAAVGGADRFNSLITWGKTALSDTEKTEAVKMLSNTKDAASATTYLLGLQARFVKENGRDPGKSSGGGGAPAPDVFKSRSAQAQAMSDPRYQNDPAYRQEVLEKSLRTWGSAKDAKKRTKPKALKKAAAKRARKVTRRARAR